MYYHIFGDKRSQPLIAIAKQLQQLSVGELWAIVRDAANECFGPGAKEKFHKLITDAAVAIEAGNKPVIAVEKADEKPAARSDLEGATAVIDGVEMTVIKATEDRVRLENSEGKKIWRSIDGLEFKKK